MEKGFKTMFEALQQREQVWEVVGHLGAASLQLPILLLVVPGLWRAGQRDALRVWLLSFSAAVLLTLGSKILYLGWDIGFKPLAFAGISGHAVLAVSILPVLFGWLLAHDRKRFSMAGAGLGLLLAAAVAVSRVMLGAHSSSEVLAAWLLGLLVSGLSLRAMKSPAGAPWFALASPLILLLAFSHTASTYLPTHAWEIKVASFLAGQEARLMRH